MKNIRNAKNYMFAYKFGSIISTIFIYLFHKINLHISWEYVKI